MIYHVGDRILCRVNKDSTIIFDTNFDDPRYAQFQIRSFEVIGIDDKMYVILSWAGVEESVPLKQPLMDLLKINTKYLGKHISFVHEAAVGGRESIDPYKYALSCVICKEFFPYAEANQANGTLVCWVCRQTRQV